MTIKEYKRSKKECSECIKLVCSKECKSIEYRKGIVREIRCFTGFGYFPIIIDLHLSGDERILK